MNSGCGLFAFATLEHVVHAIEVIDSDCGAACGAAHAIAAKDFATELVLGSLMARTAL
jgi:hypothetical protein